MTPTEQKLAETRAAMLACGIMLDEDEAEFRRAEAQFVRVSGRYNELCDFYHAALAEEREELDDTYRTNCRTR